VNIWVLSKDLTYAFRVAAGDILASPLVEVPNRYVHKGEFFYQVPIIQCVLIKLGDNYESGTGTSSDEHEGLEEETDHA
jgi:hypothetical protein